MAVHPNVKLVDKNFVKKAHIHDLKVNSYTVDNLYQMKELSKLKVDGIFTNYANIYSAIQEWFITVYTHVLT